MNAKPWIAKNGIADARLIFAAYDLLGALELAQSRILLLERNYRISVDRDAHDKINAAFVKARGEA